MPKINKIKLSGTSYDIQDSNASKTVTLTQAQYDALADKDPNTFYIISDGEMFNPSGKVDTSAFTEFSGAVETELSGKTDESAFTAHTGDSTIHVTTAQTAAWNAKSDFSGSYNDLTNKLSAGTNITIVDNVISAEGGGKAVEAGRGIDVASGTSAYTVSFNLPISAGTEEYSIQEGYSTSAISYYDHAEGYNTIANGGSYAAHAEGRNTIASGGSSHAEGRNTIAGGTYAHAEGIGTSALTFASHAEGCSTIANSNYSHTEGHYTSASSVSNVSGIEVYDGYQARHAEGSNTLANNASTHVEGYSTIANNFGEHSSGVFNNSSSASTTFGDSGNTLFSVGNGTSTSARHNAFEIRQNGDIYLTLDGQDVKLQDHLGGGGSSYSAGTGIDITNDVISVSGVVMSSAITTSITSSSTDAQVPSAKAVYDAIQEGGGGGSSYSAGTNIDITNDIISCTLNASNGNGAYSFKEGLATYANNRCAHAEGEQNLAGGAWSHAEGAFTLANADYSHTEGYQTNANNKYEHASGQYNNSVSASTTFGDRGNTLFSVGNGTSPSARHNAFEIRQNGDIYLTKDGQDIKLQDQLGGSYVTTDTEQIISGRKIFTYSASSGKAIEFKQTSNSAKVGFRIINSAETNNEVASFEFRPNTFTIDNVQHPLMYFGHYRNTNTANAGVPQTVIGFRQYDQLNAAAYHYLMPLPEKAKTPFNLTTSFKDYYAPMGFKNGSTMITADDTGVVDLSSELGGLKLVKLTQAEYDALATKDSNTLYVING